MSDETREPVDLDELERSITDARNGDVQADLARLSERYFPHLIDELRELRAENEHLKECAFRAALAAGSEKIIANELCAKLTGAKEVIRDLESTNESLQMRIANLISGQK